MVRPLDPAGQRVGASDHGQPFGIGFELFAPTQIIGSEQDARLRRLEYDVQMAGAVETGIRDTGRLHQQMVLFER